MGLQTANHHELISLYLQMQPDNFLFLTGHPDSPVKATDFGLSIRCDSTAQITFVIRIFWAFSAKSSRPVQRVKTVGVVADDPLA